MLALPVWTLAREPALVRVQEQEQEREAEPP